MLARTDTKRFENEGWGWAPLNITPTVNREKIENDKEAIKQLRILVERGYNLHEITHAYWFVRKTCCLS